MTEILLLTTIITPRGLIEQLLSLTAIFRAGNFLPERSKFEFDCIKHTQISTQECPHNVQFLLQTDCFERPIFNKILENPDF